MSCLLRVGAGLRREATHFVPSALCNFVDLSKRVEKSAMNDRPPTKMHAVALSPEGRLCRRFQSAEGTVYYVAWLAVDACIL